ncbi:MAG: pitrilysin family protein [Candidatus Muiribacteriota bacterium]
MKRFFLMFVCLLILTAFTGYAFEGEERIIVLDNGLTVILKETHVVPMVAMEAWVRAGSITEGEKTGSGLSHYFEHMLFKGTKKRGPGEIPQIIHKAGGSDFNAYTTFDRTVYHFSILNDYTETGLDILSDMLMNSVFDPEEAEKEQKVILNEINMSIDNPDTNLYWAMLETAYQIFPYRHPILGHENLFKSLTREEIQWYYETMYSPSNVILSFVGSFNMDNMISQVKKYFEPWERKMVPTMALPEEPAQITYRFKEFEREVNNSRMYMAYKSVDLAHDDVYALDCLSYILGIGQTSRLYRRLVEKDRIAHSVGSGSWTPGYPGLFMIRAVFDTENYTKVRFAIQDEVNRFKFEEVTPMELQIVKNNVLSSTVFGKETITSQSSSLASSFFYTGSLKWDDVYVDGINNVKPADIKRVAQKYLNINSMSLIHMKPAVEKTKIDRTQIATAPRPEVTVKTLDNGIKVILMEDNKLPMISINSGFFGGVRVENEKNNGISAFASTLLTKGTRKFSKNQILEIEKETGSRLGASSGNNTIFVSLKTLKNNFDKLWPVYVSILSENKFDSKDFDIEKEKIVAAIKRSAEDISSVNDRLYRQHIFKGHPYMMAPQGTEESIGGLNQDDLRAFISEFIVPDNMTIAVVGDFKTQDMLKTIENTLGRLEKSNFELPSLSKPEEIKGIRKVVENMPDKRQSVVRLAFRGIEINHEDKYAFSVLSNILSGLGSRLFENLRSKHSLAYSVYAFPFNGLETGAYVFYIATTPDKRDFAIDMMKNEINILKKEYVTDEELERAKNKLIGGDSAKLQSTLGMAEELVLDEMYGLTYEEVFTFAEKVKKVSKQDIMRVAKKYFDLDNCVLAIVEP